MGYFNTNTGKHQLDVVGKTSSGQWHIQRGIIYLEHGNISSK